MSAQTDSSTIQPPLYYSDNGPGMVISLTILGFIASIFVILRFWGRRLIRQPFGWDDYLCLAALIAHHVVMIAGCVAVVDGGLGRDMRITATQNPHSVVILFQSLFATQVAYTFSSPLVKLSVLALYWRIFPTTAVKMGCKVFGSLCIAWSVVVTVLNFIQCRPLKAFWFTALQELPTTKCLDMMLCFLSNSIANTLIDLFTLILPIQQIVKLHTTPRRKFNICCIFLLGSVAFAASLARTISTGLMHTEGITNFTKQFVVPGVASVVEIYVAVIGSCLPTMIPIYRKLRYGDPLKSNTGHLSKATPIKGSIGPWRHVRSDEGSFERFTDSEDVLTPTAYKGNHRINVSSSRKNDDFVYGQTESYNLEGVMVTHDTVWSESHQSHPAI